MAYDTLDRDELLQKVRDILREKQDKGYPPFSEVIAKELNLEILKVKQELGYNSHSYSTRYLHIDSGIKFVINEYYSDEPPQVTVHPIYEGI